MGEGKGKMSMEQDNFASIKSEVSNIICRGINNSKEGKILPVTLNTLSNEGADAIINIIERRRK